MKKVQRITFIICGAILLFLTLVLVQIYIGRSKALQNASDFVRRFSVKESYFVCFSNDRVNRNRRKEYIVQAEFTKVASEARNVLELKGFSDDSQSQDKLVFRSKSEDVYLYVVGPNPAKYNQIDGKPVTIISVEYREHTVIGELLNERLNFMCQEF